MTININNSNKYKGSHFKYNMYCNKGYTPRGMPNVNREYYKNKNTNGSQRRILDNNMFSHNNVQNKNKETFHRKLLKTENGNFGKEIMENATEEKKEIHVLKVLKREMGLESNESNFNSNNIIIMKEGEEFMNQIKEDASQKNKRKEMLKLEEIERVFTNRTDCFNKKTQQDMIEQEQNENEMEKGQCGEEKEVHMKNVSTQNLLSLFIKKVNGTLCKDVEQSPKEKAKLQTQVKAENVLEMNSEDAKGKEENKLDLKKMEWNIVDSNKMDSNKISNFYMLEQLEQTFYNNLDQKRKEKKTQKNIELEDIGTVEVDADAHMKKKMGEEILNMINKRYTEQTVQVERGLNRQFSAVNESQMMHANKMNGKDLIGFNTRINGNNSFLNAYKMSSFVNTGSKNSTIIKNFLERDIHLLRKNKKMTIDFNNTNVEDIDGTRMSKSSGNKSAPSKIVTRDIENIMENNASTFKKEFCKSKNVKSERIPKKKKGESSLFVMPLFMRSPEPEQIPIPVYLSDDGKDATTTKKEQCLMSREQVINTEKEFITVENIVLIRNEDILGDKMLKISNGNNEKELSWDSNNTDISFISSKSREKSIKHILNFHLNKKPLINTPRKSGFKIVKKNNGSNSSNTFSYFNSIFNKETNKNGKFDILNNSVRSFKKRYRTFNSIKFNEIGSENLCGNGFFNPNQNIKQYKVDKYINIRRFKTKNNFYDGYRSRYMYVPPNDIKIAAY